MYSGVVIAVLALLPVGSLLAWTYRFGSFAAWFWAMSAPAIVALFAIGVWAWRRSERLRMVFVTGVTGGLVGTLGYDLFRVPFVVTGRRLLAPIDSYGVLLLGAHSSSALTGFAGWMYHFSNGIGFGVFFAAVALGRRWWWGVVWAMALETATIMTPFANTYAIAGHWDVIAIAYSAHVFYGLPLGRIVEAGPRFVAAADRLSRRTTGWALVALVAVLLVWLHPYSESSAVRDGQRVAPGASAVVRNGRMAPAWLRVPVGGCATLRDDDPVPYTAKGARGAPVLVPSALTRVCFDKAGVKRFRLSAAAYSGGFVIVDPNAP